MRCAGDRGESRRCAHRGRADHEQPALPPKLTITGTLPRSARSVFTALCDMTGGDVPAGGPTFAAEGVPETEGGRNVSTVLPMDDSHARGAPGRAGRRRGARCRRGRRAATSGTAAASPHDREQSRRPGGRYRRRQRLGATAGRRTAGGARPNAAAAGVAGDAAVRAGSRAAERNGPAGGPASRAARDDGTSREIVVDAPVLR